MLRLMEELSLWEANQTRRSQTPLSTVNTLVGIALNRCTLLDNEAVDGGGIFAKDKSFTEVRNTVFTNNTATKMGGAVCSLRSWLLVEEIEVVGSTGAPPGPTITIIGGQFLIDGDSFGFV